MEINKILGITESYKAPETILNILYDKEKREKIFLEFLKLYKKNVSYDWFNKYFEEEHSDRKVKKQDFTPVCVSEILNKLTDNKNAMNYDVASGTGGITINRWWQECLQYTPFTYIPSEHFYTCEELSDRAIPFLIFNLAIRGMNAAILHCDSLERTCKGIFFIKNKRDDSLAFSSIYLMPYNETVEKYFNVKFTEFRYKEFDERDVNEADRLLR